MSELSIDSNELAPGYLIVDKNGVVASHSPEVTQMLGSSAVGLDLRAFMSDTLAELHLEVILPLYFQTVDRSSWDHVIGQHIRRKSSLIDTQGNIVHIEVTVEVTSINLSGDYNFLLRVYPNHTPRTTLDFNRRCLLAARLRIGGRGGPRKVPVAVLVVDIVNSTEILKASSHNSYLHHVSMQTAAKELLVGRYNPLVTLYESVGDSMLFVTLPGNACALIQRPQCKILVNFARDLTKNVSPTGVSIRSSASFGETLCTVMDGQVRLFGMPVTRACRLQAHVAPSQGTGVYDSMMVCEAFYQKLLCELRQTPSKEEPSARELHCHLKGFGEDIVCRCLDIGNSFGRQES
jgi:class 3 adenylate cyclase